MDENTMKFGRVLTHEESDPEAVVAALRAAPCPWVAGLMARAADLIEAMSADMDMCNSKDVHWHD